MKTISYYFIVFFVLPFVVSAQPVSANGEFYYIGDVIQMINCDATAFSAGSGDSATSWDFTGLVPSGIGLTTKYARETSPSFLNCNIVATSSTGMKSHEQENSGDTYINGIEDTSTGIITYYSRYNISKRPLTFNTSYVDTFYVTVPATGKHGTGILKVKGDGYGTLIIPTGTFNNVLRVKKVETETDSLGSDIYYTTRSSYLWFDGFHRSPLLRMDSVTGSLGESNTLMYLANPAGVRDVNNQVNDFKGYLNNNELMLSGSFETGVVYEVAMYNIIGSLVLKEEFTTPNNYYRIDIPGQLTPGIYVVCLLQKNDPAAKSVVKVIRQ